MHRHTTAKLNLSRGLFGFRGHKTVPPLSLYFDTLLTCVQHLALGFLEFYNMKSDCFSSSLSQSLPSPPFPLPFPESFTYSPHLSSVFLSKSRLQVSFFRFFTPCRWQRGQRHESRMSGEAHKLMAMSNLTHCCCSGCAGAAL